MGEWDATLDVFTYVESEIIKSMKQYLCLDYLMFTIKSMVMRVFRLLLIAFVSIQEAQSMQNIVLTNGNDIELCNVNKNEKIKIAEIEDLGLWELANCCLINGKYTIFLYNRFDYQNFIKKRFLKEVILEFDGEKTIIIRDTIVFKDSFYRIFQAKVHKLPISDINDLFATKNCLSHNTGVVQIRDSVGNAVSLLVPKEINRNIQVGFFNPCLSKDKKRIVCEKIAGKHDWKKRIGESSVVEYNIEDERFSSWTLIGRHPLYSEDGNYVLYRSGCICRIYDIKVGKESFSCEGQQAIWVCSTSYLYQNPTK